MAYRDTIVALRAVVEQDAYTGNETRVWDDLDRPPAETPPLSADVQPAGTEELTDRRQVTVTSWTVNCVPADIAAVDRVRWDGDVYEVTGEVGLLKAAGRPHHLEFAIRRIS